MPGFVQDVLAYLGYRDLRLDFDERTRSQVLLASVFPLAVVAALLVQIYVEYRYDGSLFGIAEGPPEFWARAYGVAFTVLQFGPALAVAVLFALGIQRWRAVAGAWMALIGLGLAVLSIGFGTSAATLHMAAGTEEAFNLRSFTWSGWAATFGMLAIGYFFVAYRSTEHVRQRPVRRRRRRRPGRGDVQASGSGS